MMKCKLALAALSLAGALLLASTANAQLTRPTVVGVGSSAQFFTFGIAAVSPDPIAGTSAPCGTSFWTTDGTIASAKDARATGIPPEPGNLFVAWDSDTAPTKLCVYLSVDSVVGQRLFFGRDSSGNSATIVLASSALTSAGKGKISFVQDNCSGSTTGCAGLPTAIYNAVNGANVNVAFTDIRPEDGVFANGRAFAPLDSVSKTGLGYGGTGGIGVAILDSYNTANVANVIAYNILGNDPFTSQPEPTFQTYPIGAAPVVVFVNTVDTNLAAATNANTHVLSSIFSGQYIISNVLGGVTTPSRLQPVQREPVSGTYNTFESQIVRARDGHTDLSQETGFDVTGGSSQNYGTNCFVPTATFKAPTASGFPTCSNPENVPVFGAYRTRAVGTGDMVSAVNSTTNPDAIGYAFFSLGSFGGKTNIKYLSVDGVDPLYPTYSTNGAFPNCSGKFNASGGSTFTCVGAQPTFDGIQGGNYRVWSTYRAIANPSDANIASITGLITAAQDQAHVNIHDFVPYSATSSSACTFACKGLLVFRSHYNISGFSGNNGTVASYANTQTNPAYINTPAGVESGGDMFGSQFPVTADVASVNEASTELFTFIE